MILSKRLSIVILTALAIANKQHLVAHAQSDDDASAELHFFDEEFDPSKSSGSSSGRIPRKCMDDIKKGKPVKSKDCIEWINTNPDFKMPTLEPTTMAPTPFFQVSSFFKENSIDPVLEVKLTPVDDTFIEVWRYDEPLGHQDKLKIDAIDGIPTKVIMMKFALGHILREYHEGDTHKMNATLTGAKLRLFAITDAEFGGWIQEINNDWNEETAVWKDYARKGKKGASVLLPKSDDVIGEFGNITEGYWYEADLTKRLVDIFEQDNNDISKFSLSLTTDSSDGVIYASKEYEGLGPELILDFRFTGGLEDNDKAGFEQSMIEPSTRSPAANEDFVNTYRPTGTPSVPSPLITLSPEGTENVTFVADDTSGKPAQSPTTKNPTESPVATEAVVVDSTTSVVSSSFKMTITAIEELFRTRHLRHDNRDLSAFTSVDEKERPALKTHILHVSKIILDNPPEDIMLSFEDEVIVETIPKSNSDSGGIRRISTFRVIGDFNNADVRGVTAAQLASLLDQIISYAFVGFQKKQFLEILSNTGTPIYTTTASQDVSVTKVEYLSTTGENGGGFSFATDNGNMVARSEDASSSITWIQPTLIAGAALLFVATSSAALLIFRLKSSQSLEIQAKLNSNESPRSLEETAACSTPSPTMFVDRWKNKKFNYAEFQDDPNAEDSAGEMSPTICPTTSKYLNHDQPVTIKFSHFMSSSFEDSSVSDVSGHMLGTKGPTKEDDAVKEDSSQAESLLLDTTAESYNMETMSELNPCLENVLQLNGTSPQKMRNRTDDSSHMTNTSAVPSELYSDINSIDSREIPYDYETEVTYASHVITLDMMKNIDMPPPPSDVASDTSSYQDEIFCEVDHNLHFEGTNEERLIQHAKTHVQNTDCLELSRTKTELINDELSKVMKLLNTSSKDGDEYVDDYGSPESSAEIYIQSGSDTESVSLGATSVLENKKSKIFQGFYDDNSELSTEASKSIESPAQDFETNDVDVTNDCVHSQKGDVSDLDNEENDPLQAMNVALNECIQILDKATGHD